MSVAPSQPAPMLTALYSVYVPDESVRKLRVITRMKKHS